MHNRAMLAALLILAVAPQTHTSAIAAQSDGPGAAPQAASRPDPDAPPGGMTLVPGYKHGRRPGFDTKQGRIWKEGGLVITYDMGEVAGDQARGHAEDNPRAWSISAKNAGGDSIIITMDEAAQLLLVTVGSSANFEAQGVRSQRDIAEVLSMVLTYDRAKDLGLR